MPSKEHQPFLLALFEVYVSVVLSVFILLHLPAQIHPASVITQFLFQEITTRSSATTQEGLPTQAMPSNLVKFPLLPAVSRRNKNQ